MDTFTRAYITAALWASTDANDAPMDDNYDVCDLAPETVTAMEADCADFQESNASDLAGCDLERAGHDFWLTRNRHGAGFWDGDCPKEIGARLTEASHAYGSSDLYVGDDGKVHAS